MDKQSFLKALSQANDEALMRTDTIEGTQRVNSARCYALEMANVFLSYEEALADFKRKF